MRLRIAAALLVILPVSSVFSRTGWTEDNIHGRVKEIMIKEYQYNNIFGLISTNLDHISVIDYDSNGLKKSRNEEDRLGFTQLRFEYINNDKGLRAKVREYDNEGRMVAFMVNSYDENGYLVCWSVYSNDNTLENLYTNVYDSSNFISEQTTFDSNGRIYQKNMMSCDMKGNVTNDYVYRNDGFVEVRFYYDYTYDTLGNIKQALRYKISELFGKPTDMLDRVYYYTYKFW